MTKVKTHSIKIMNITPQYDFTTDMKINDKAKTNGSKRNVFFSPINLSILYALAETNAPNKTIVGYMQLKWEIGILICLKYNWKKKVNPIRLNEKINPL